MTLEITPSGQACGAEIRGVDLSAPLPAEIVAGIRAAWLEHQVLSFPDQSMSDEDLERFTLYFGPFGEDPFIASIPGHQHIIAVQRAADETAPIFAESWHTDWSFQASKRHLFVRYYHSAAGWRHAIRQSISGAGADAHGTA